MSATSSGKTSAAPADEIVGAMARHAARRSSDAVIASTARRATFGEIDALSRAVSERLFSGSPERGRLVGLVAPNGPAFLAGFIALRRAGQVALLLDPLAPDEDRRRAATTLGASGVLECADAWPTAAGDFRMVGTTVPGAPPMPDGIAAVKLTSGSTGLPRGVAMRTENLLADEDALARTMGLRDDDRLWGAVPFSHSYGFTTLALSALVRGLMLVVPGDRTPFASLADARELGATVFPTAPAYLQALLKLPVPLSWPDRVRLVISAGAMLPSATAAELRQVYGQLVHTFYGSSECGGICYDREGGAAERGTVGTPVDGVSLSLMGQEQLAADEGLVVVKSPGVGATYVPEGEPRLDSGRFETSDVGAWQGGELALRRRLDRVINVRGRKVDPSEVELVLSSLAGVEEVVVMGVASPDGRDQIVSAVIAGSSTRPKYRDVVAWCRHRLADHKVPRSVVFVDVIPRTSRGKIDRSALLALGGQDQDSRETHG